MTNRNRRQNPEKVSRGVSRTKGGLKRTVVAFDEETHEYIRAKAIAENSSFAAQVRELVEFGIMEVDKEKPKSGGSFINTRWDNL